MPTLILSSRYTTESKILRKAAEVLGWETFRMQGDRLPPDYDRRDLPHAIYCTVPNAFHVASRLGSILLGCSPEWLVELPEEFSRRSIRFSDLRAATKIRETCFIKPALGKSFDAAVRTGSALIAEASHLPAELLVHISETVEWEVEYRCFIQDQEVRTLSPYRRGAVTFSDYTMPMKGPRAETDAAAAFANSLLKSVTCPPAFVLDVGRIKGRGWAVVEPNECWGAGIYGCAPAQVLAVLLAANVSKRSATAAERKWDYESHYFRACPHMDR